MDFLRSHSRKGRSRFSKALPTPPSPKADSSPKSKQLPSIPPVPPLPSKKFFTMSDKPLPPPHALNQSLPPLPPLQTKALPPVHIARRPVAKQPPTPSSQPQPTTPDHDDYDDDRRQSIGSLLSAYSRTSGESLMSPDGSTSQRDSAPTYASDHQYGTREAKILTPTSLSSGDNERRAAPNFTPNKGLPPHPAYLNEQQGPPPPAKPDRTPTVGSPTSVVSSSSPQRPLWRRRSVKSDRNIEVPQLRLEISHGSTAASQPNTAQSPYSATSPRTQQQQQQQQLPPRSASGLPGRNIRPVPSQNKAPETDSMGQEVSRLKGKISHLRDGQEGANRGASHSDTALSPTQRLPTPDYDKGDVKTHVVDSVVSPISPASSPEPARDQASNEQKPPVPRKAVTAARNLHAAQSLPQIRTDGPVTNSEAPPTISRDFAVSPISPKRQNQLSPRSTSIQQHQQQQQQQQQPGQWQQPAREYAPYAPHAQGDRRPSSQDQRPQQEAVQYRELKVKDLPPADPRAAYFPTHGSEPLSPSTIHKALPLKESMLDCYVKHRTMDRTRNRNYALTCQTCGKADTEDRYKCQFCYVRMCGSCLQIFNSNRRDLKKLMAHLEGNPHSGGSQERPATAGGTESMAKMGEQHQQRA
ncbi:hypothetical protein LZ30DRAFT_689903 [Colletotrichum cereale]|nr:hypothetical protein LZ30DRAFT_689903 [Colletotrichum cereale]